ncbi:MAG: ABC transporter permease, partial [Sphingomicrobium sp.]
GFNGHGVAAIYRFEMARSTRTLWQSLVTPVITTALYFVVFGAAIGGRMADMDGISFGAFIVPGLTLLSVFMQSIFNASFGIYFPKFTGTIYELLSAPISSLEVVLAYVGAAVTKSMVLALVTLATATIFVDVRVEHPAMMLLFLLLITIAFSLLGFVIGIWAQNFEQLQIIPMMIVTPLTFLGGAFYSVNALGEPWRTVTLFNPVVYLVSGFRWTFFGVADVPVWASMAVLVGIIAVCLAGIAWVFKTGYRLKQ